MGDLKFSCPHCQQHIQGDANYAGLEISCPACNQRLTVPGTRPPAAPVVAAAAACPSCGAILMPGARICTQCGTNLATGLKVQAHAAPPPRPTPGASAAARAAAARKPAAGGWLSNPPVVTGILLAIFGALYGLAWMNPTMVLVFVLVAVLYFLTVKVLVLIAAFKESAGTGFMTLCIPFYELYFVFGINENPLLKGLYSVSLLLYLAMGSLKHMLPEG